MEYLVNTPCGPVKGCPAELEGVAVYRGIRYASAGRWEYPKQVTKWDGIYDATTYGSCAYQARAFYNEEERIPKRFYYCEFRRGESYTYSEDCLFLNIWTPDKAKSGENLPVIVYIHGGSFTGGCGHEKHLKSPLWPQKGVIAVTLNYRLGPFGFLVLPQLKEEAGFTGNYGLYDQMTAIQWVKDNIASFGGDPENITIMGQSAGAMSVQQHCLSPLTDGLFQKAVMSSGGGVSKVLSAVPAERGYAFWQKVMENAGCKELAQFRELPADKLFEVWQQTQKEMKGGGCVPCIDGRLVVGSGSDLLAAGRQKNIHYMVGSTSHDMVPPVLYAMAKSWCKKQNKPSYIWFFDRLLPGDEKGAWHCADLWYWFGTLGNGWRPWEQKDYELSDLMTDYLTNFAKKGNPNCAGRPEWVAAGTRAMCIGEQKAHMANPNLLKLIGIMLTDKTVGGLR